MFKTEEKLKIQKATLQDAKDIYDLIVSYEGDAVLLPRTLDSICEDICSFVVARVNGKVIGCCSLKIWTDKLAEVRSLVVLSPLKGKGLGSLLVKAALKQAHKLKIKEVFTLTNACSFFRKVGFTVAEKSQFPLKIWSDCLNCPKINHCDETAMTIRIGE